MLDIKQRLYTFDHSYKSVCRIIPNVTVAKLCMTQFNAKTPKRNVTGNYGNVSRNYGRVTRLKNLKGLCRDK